MKAPGPLLRSAHQPSPGFDMNILYELREGVAIITLDRPDKLNALTVPMREALGTHFETAARDPAVRVVLLQGSGKAFCASGDVSKMGEFTAESGRTLLKLAHRMVRNLAARSRSSAITM